METCVWCTFFLLLLLHFPDLACVSIWRRHRFHSFPVSQLTRFVIPRQVKFYCTRELACLFPKLIQHQQQWREGALSAGPHMRSSQPYQPDPVRTIKLRLQWLRLEKQGLDLRYLRRAMEMGVPWSLSKFQWDIRCDKIKNIQIFEANYLRPFWPPYGLRGQIWPRQWLFLGQKPLPTTF